MTMKAALLAATLTGLTALPAQAQTAGTPNTVVTSVNARAGLAPLTAVSCTPVNFGVWRVPVRPGTGPGSGTTTITLTAPGGVSNAAVGGTDTRNVSNATKYLPPSAGVCTVIGAMNINKSDDVRIAANTGMQFTSSNHESLATPGTLAALSADLTTETSVAIDAFGAGSFLVTGVLTIPAKIEVANYGGYETGNPAEIFVDDIIPPATNTPT